METKSSSTYKYYKTNPTLHLILKYSLNDTLIYRKAENFTEKSKKIKLETAEVKVIL